MFLKLLGFQQTTKPERPLRDKFDTDSKIASASPRLVRQSVDEILASPLTSILFESAEWRDGQQLKIIPSAKSIIDERHIRSPAEYDSKHHCIIAKRDVLPRKIVINHELRHAWQTVALDTRRYTVSDPYTHFMFKQIIEADAHAYSNIIYDMEDEDAQIPLTPEKTALYVERYRRDFLRFLLGDIFLTRDFLNIELEKYKYSHIRTVSYDSHPFSWVNRGKEKPEQPHARPERVTEAIEQLAIVGLTEHPVRFFSSNDAQDITEMLFDAHSKHPIIAPKLAEIYENLRGHYGPR